VKTTATGAGKGTKGKADSVGKGRRVGKKSCWECRSEGQVGKTTYCFKRVTFGKMPKATAKIGQTGPQCWGKGATRGRDQWSSNRAQFSF